MRGKPPGARRRRAHPGHLRFQRQVFWQAPAHHLPFQPSGRPDAPFSPCERKGQGGGSQGRCFGKPLCAISGFRQQDAQTPPSPRVGEGGWGMRGKRAPQRSGRHRGTTAFLALLLRLQASRRVRAGGARTQGISASSGRFFGKPLHFFSRFGLQDAQTPPSLLVGEAHRGRFFGEPLRSFSRFGLQDAKTPPSLLGGEGGWGYVGQKRTGIVRGNHPPRLRVSAPGRARGADSARASLLAGSSRAGTKVGARSSITIR